MTDPEKIDIDRLRNPGGMYHLLEPTEAKLNEFADRLRTGYLYVSDEIRNPDYLRALVYDLYSQRAFNLVYEIGDFKGVLGFINMVWDHKADMMLKLWDTSVWGPDCVGQARDLIQYIVETFGLSRVGTVTADPRVVKMAKMVGFKVEGERKLAFSWNKKLHNETLLSITRE